MSASELLERISPETAWAPFQPTRRNRWDQEKVAHLYRRATFGATWEVVQKGIDTPTEELVDSLISGGRDWQQFEIDIARLRKGVLESKDARELQALWMYRLLASPHPLLERMTLFWHDHFATSNAKVNDVILMSDQNESLRHNALGHFGDMLQAMTRDPAMLIWLDSNTNRKEAPNENYAREIFELFSLGEGHYTENDIKEAARALTGWSVGEDRRALFSPENFDDGEKTVFGHTGHWTSGDVVRLCLENEWCAKFIVQKLFGELVSEAVQPSEELLEPLVVGFRLRNYDITWLVRTILCSWVFYSEIAIRQRVKSPVEFVVQTVRSLGGQVSPRDASDICQRMGQSLFFPPSVKGWDGGREWINSNTLLFRQNVAYEITRGSGNGMRCDPARIANAQGLEEPEALADYFLQLFHQQASDASRAQIVDRLNQLVMESGGMDRSRTILPRLAREAAHLAMTMPEYQLG
jgi:uncharacterized protein (DUF1800 family)